MRVHGVQKSGGGKKSQNFAHGSPQTLFPSERAFTEGSQSIYMDVHVYQPVQNVSNS